MLNIKLSECIFCGGSYSAELEFCPRCEDVVLRMGEHAKPYASAKQKLQEKPQKGQSKQNSKKVLYDGYTFDSQLECKRYRVLKLRQISKHISGLEVHPKFILMPKIKGVVSAITYEADFSYWYSPNGFLGHPETKFVVEDIKATYSNTKKNIANKLAGKPIIKADARLRHKLVIAQLWGKYGTGAEFRIITDVEE